MRSAALMLMFTLGPALAFADPCEQADAKAVAAGATKDGITACFQICWTFDGATWRPADAKAPKPPVPSDITIPAPVDKSADGAHTMTADGLKLSLVDTKTHKSIAVIKAWKTPMMENGFQVYGFADDSPVVWLSSTPVSSQARIYNLRGKLVSKIGRGEVQEGALGLGKGRWLFAQFEGNELYVYEVAKGKKLATIALGSARVIKEGSRMGDALLAVTGDKVWAMQGEADSGAAVYDLATGKQKRVPLPLCK